MTVGLLDIDRGGVGRDIRSTADRLELRPSDSRANVALASGKYNVVFDGTGTDDGMRMAALKSAAVDVFTAPGRNRSEATALLGWMARPMSPPQRR